MRSLLDRVLLASLKEPELLGTAIAEGRIPEELLVRLAELSGLGTNAYRKEREAFIVNQSTSTFIIPFKNVLSFRYSNSELYIELYGALSCHKPLVISINVDENTYLTFKHRLLSYWNGAIYS